VTTYSPYSAYPSPESALPFQAEPPPILVAVADRAPQRRVTVGFRLIMLIPHAIVLFLLAIAALVVAFLGWWGALFMGRLPEFAQTFLSGYLRWLVRVNAYVLLLTDVYPPFSLEDDPNYPVRIALPPAQRLNRAAVFFRLILIIPAGFVADFLIYGAGSVMAFVAWLITLVTGQLPDSFHFANSAVLRYLTRYYGYGLLLTPAYPGRVFGDVPGTPTWADAAAPAPAPPGFGSPESVYGGPGAQGGYGYPAQPDHPAQADYTPPADYPPQSDYQAQPGYSAQPGSPTQSGYPAQPGYPVQPGYGYPGGYGVRPAFQPASWLLVLPTAAKRLLTVFIVLGVILYAGDLVYQGSVISRSASQVNNVQTAQNALNRLNASYGTLTNEVTSWESAIQACDENLTCVTGQDAKAAGYFTTFDNQLTATAMPANSVTAAGQLDQVGTQSAQDFTELSKVTTVTQYQSVVNSTGLETTLNDFDTKYNALVSALERN
jgi:hypothetical protein